MADTRFKIWLSITKDFMGLLPIFALLFDGDDFTTDTTKMFGNGLKGIAKNTKLKAIFQEIMIGQAVATTK